MISPRDRTAVTALLKKRGAKAKRGRLPLVVGELTWFVDLRVEGRGSAAGWTLEVGCWVPGLTPEPEGGAIDCPLLWETPAGEDLLAAVGGVVDGVETVGDLGALAGWIAERPDALVDRVLRERL